MPSILVAASVGVKLRRARTVKYFPQSKNDAVLWITGQKFQSSD
jgi:hypothetical protein